MTTSRKPTWMKIHTGILAAKHREAMGVRIWLFMYLIDNADWETGVMDGYTDQKAADALEMPRTTVRNWRRELQEKGYVTSRQGLHCQKVQIHKWRNPRQAPDQVMETQSGHHEEDISWRLDSVSIPDATPISLKQSDHHLLDSDSGSHSKDKDSAAPAAAATPPEPEPTPEPIPVQPAPPAPKPKRTRKASATKTVEKTPHQRMYDAITAVFRWTSDLNDNERGQVNKASKLLRQSQVTPEDIPALFAWCKAQDWPGLFSPVAMANHVQDWRNRERVSPTDGKRDDEVVYANGMTRAEARQRSAELQALYTQEDAAARAAYEAIMAGGKP